MSSDTIGTLISMEHQLNWSPGNHGKGIQTGEGETHTWNVDRQDGTPNHQEYLEGVLGARDTNPYAEYNAFEIGPEGRVYEGPSDIDKLDPRLVPTDKWNFQSGTRTAISIGDILSNPGGVPQGPPKHSMPCPQCGQKSMVDDQEGGLHCRDCGHVTKMGWDDPESWVEGKFNWDFNLPLEGMSQNEEPGERNWVVPTRSFGPSHFGNWLFGNSTGTTHYNRWTGERCSCPWNDQHAKLRKFAGPNLNKVLKAPDKALRTPEGEEFKRMLAAQLGEEHESLAPYLAHRFKKGDVRVGQAEMGEEGFSEGDGPPKRLEFWQGTAPLDAMRDTWKKNREAEGISEEVHQEHRYSPERQKAAEDNGFNPLGRNTLANWHKWYEARQHPLRRGIDVMHGDFTPQKLNERAVSHNAEVRHEKEIEELSHAGRVVHKFPPQEGGVTGVDWDSVAENEPDYATGLSRMNVEQAEREGKGDADPELRSLRDMYPKKVAPRKSGWHIKQLQDAEDLRAEGTMMGHCIGNDEKYGNCLEHGLIQAYSLRDPKGRPHVTWHYNSDGSLAEMFGPNDDDVKPEYQDMLNEWGAQENRPADKSQAEDHQEEDPEEDRELPEVRFPEATDVADYIHYHHPEHMYDAATEYEDEEGRLPGEHTEISAEEPQWESVGADYADQYKQVYHAPEGFSPEQIQHEQEWRNRAFERQQKEFFEAIKQHGHQSEMQEALQYHMNETYGENGENMEPGEEPDNDHVRNIQRWNAEFPSWEATIPQPPPGEGEAEDAPRMQERPQPGIVWPHTPHLYDPDSTWKIGPGGEGQQQIFSAVEHHLGWEPGQWGKGLVHDGAVHTWGVGENEDGSPTHPEYAEKAFGMNDDQFGNHAMYDSAFSVSPEGVLNVFEDNGWSSHPENSGKVAAQAETADPRLRTNPSQGTWDFEARVAKNDDKWQLWNFQSSTRSLYHGTLIDHLPSIQQSGLVPDVGGFTSDAYELDPEGRDDPGRGLLHSRRVRGATGHLHD